MMPTLGSSAIALPELCSGKLKMANRIIAEDGVLPVCALSLKRANQKSGCKVYPVSPNTIKVIPASGFC